MSGYELVSPMGSVAVSAKLRPTLPFNKWSSSLKSGRKVRLAAFGL
jgi:hypothetical protein